MSRQHHQPLRYPLKPPLEHDYDVQQYDAFRPNDVLFLIGNGTVDAEDNFVHTLPMPFNSGLPGHFYISVKDWSLDTNFVLQTIVEPGSLINDVFTWQTVTTFTEAIGYVQTTYSITLTNTTQMTNLPLYIVYVTNQQLTSLAPTLALGWTAATFTYQFVLRATPGGANIVGVAPPTAATITTQSTGNPNTYWGNVDYVKTPSSTANQMVLLSFGPQMGPAAERYIERPSLAQLQQKSQLIDYQNLQNNQGTGLILPRPTDAAWGNFYTDFSQAALNQTSSTLASALFSPGNVANRSILGYTPNQFSNNGGIGFCWPWQQTTSNVIGVDPSGSALNTFQNPRSTQFGCATPIDVEADIETCVVSFKAGSSNYIACSGPPLQNPGRIQGMPFLLTLQNPQTMSATLQAYLLTITPNTPIAQTVNRYSMLAIHRQSINTQTWSNLYNNVLMGYSAAAIAMQEAVDMQNFAQLNGTVRTSWVPDYTHFQTRILLSPLAQPGATEPIQYTSSQVLANSNGAAFTNTSGRNFAQSAFTQIPPLIDTAPNQNLQFLQPAYAGLQGLTQKIGLLFGAMFIWTGRRGGAMVGWSQTTNMCRQFGTNQNFYIDDELNYRVTGAPNNLHRFITMTYGIPVQTPNQVNTLNEAFTLLANGSFGLNLPDIIGYNGIQNIQFTSFLTDQTVAPLPTLQNTNINVRYTVAPATFQDTDVQYTLQNCTATLNDFGPQLITTTGWLLDRRYVSETGTNIGSVLTIDVSLIFQNALDVAAYDMLFYLTLIPTSNPATFNNVQQILIPTTSAILTGMVPNNLAVYADTYYTGIIPIDEDDILAAMPSNQCLVGISYAIIADGGSQGAFNTYLLNTINVQFDSALSMLRPLAISNCDYLNSTTLEDGGASALLAEDFLVSGDVVPYPEGVGLLPWEGNNTDTSATKATLAQDTDPMWKTSTNNLYPYTNTALALTKQNLLALNYIPENIYASLYCADTAIVNPTINHLLNNTPGSMVGNNVGGIQVSLPAPMPVGSMGIFYCWQDSPYILPTGRCANNANFNNQVTTAMYTDYGNVIPTDPLNATFSTLRTGLPAGAVNSYNSINPTQMPVTYDYLPIWASPGTNNYGSGQMCYGSSAGPRTNFLLVPKMTNAQWAQNYGLAAVAPQTEIGAIPFRMFVQNIGGTLPFSYMNLQMTAVGNTTFQSGTSSTPCYYDLNPPSAKIQNSMSCLNLMIQPQSNNTPANIANSHQWRNNTLVKNPPNFISIPYSQTNGQAYITNPIPDDAFSLSGIAPSWMQVAYPANGPPNCSNTFICDYYGQWAAGSVAAPTPIISQLMEYSVGTFQTSRDADTGVPLLASVTQLTTYTYTPNTTPPVYTTDVQIVEAQNKFSYPLVNSYQGNGIGYQKISLAFYVNGVKIPSSAIKFYKVHVAFGSRDASDRRVGGDRFEKHPSSSW